MDEIGGVPYDQQATDRISAMIAEHDALLCEYDEIYRDNPGSTALKLPFEPGYRPGPLEDWLGKLAAAMARLRQLFLDERRDADLNRFPIARYGEAINFGHGGTRAWLIDGLREHRRLLSLELQRRTRETLSKSAEDLPTLGTSDTPVSDEGVVTPRFRQSERATAGNILRGAKGHAFEPDRNEIECIRAGWRKDWNEKLKAARENRQHSQKEAAEQLRVSFETYRKWEAGRTPHRRNIPAIIHYFRS